MATLTSDTATITTDLVLTFDTTREPRSVVHKVLDRPDPDVTFRAAASRTGVLRIFLPTHAEAQAAEDQLRVPRVWTFSAAPVEPGAVVVFAVTGPLRVSAEGQGSPRWVVEVDFTEVVP